MKYGLLGTKIYFIKYGLMGMGLIFSFPSHSKTLQQAFSERFQQFSDTELEVKCFSSPSNTSGTSKITVSDKK